MMGSVDEPAPFYRHAPEPLRHEIEKFNLLIHALEDDLCQLQRDSRSERRDVRIVVTFKGRRRVPLTISELKEFGLARCFGVAYLNYCMVGKHLLEACLDKDQITGAIRPQTHLSADTLLWFGASPTPDEMEERKAALDDWWAQEGIERRFARSDPASAVGYLPVADICLTEGDALARSEEEITNLLAGATIKSFKAV